MKQLTELVINGDALKCLGKTLGWGYDSLTIPGEIITPEMKLQIVECLSYLEKEYEKQFEKLNQNEHCLVGDRTQGA